MQVIAINMLRENKAAACLRSQEEETHQVRKVLRGVEVVCQGDDDLVAQVVAQVHHLKEAPADEW